ncbi:MAG: hypothetical protein JSS83_01900 [Cyanobacteria bacterium SZAS LIN-3]|nr:hypothetical protein [Cyanobacteria bacterium SZAS LIN-3]
MKRTALETALVLLTLTFATTTLDGRAEAPPAPTAAAASATGSAEAQLKPVLDPGKFFGKAKAGYAAAKDCPEICAKLFCYCGCDLTDEHNSLLDCFTSDHGVDCYICQEEALVALKMKKQGKGLAEIQKAVDLAYRREYPFDDKSPAYKKYMADRLWKDDGKNTAGSQGGASSAKGKNGATTSDAKKGSTSTLQDAAKHSTKGSCCSGKAKAK